MKHAASNRPAAVLAALAVLALAAAITVAPEHAEAAAGSFVESVTIAKYPSSSAAIDALLAGEIDMYYDDITAAEVQRVSEAGHDVYESPGGTYSIYVNPVDDFTNGFNPFSQQGARYALNYVVDRSHVVDGLLMGSGAEMFSALPPGHRDYPLIYNEVESLGFSHDLDEADRLFTEALTPTGAQKVNGVWHHGGQPVVIKMFIRSDDPVRLQFGERLASDLQRVGFGVQKSYGNLLDAGSRVYASDPADQQWHIYTEGWGNSRTAKYDDLQMSIFYAPIFGNLPGQGEEHAWNYQNDTLDLLAAYLFLELYDSSEERAELLSAMSRAGVTESVRVFLAAEHESYPVRAGTAGVVNAPGYGITSKYTPLNVQLPGGDPSLSIGTNHVVQSSWNPVGGFTDVYSSTVWSLLRDTDQVRNPHSADLLDGRNVLVSVETEGPDGKLDVPPGAMTWDPEEHKWAAVGPGERATSKVVFDLRLGNWHHGVPMDLNDVLFPITFNIEHHVMHSHEEILDSDPHATLHSSGRFVAVEVIDDDTIGLYVDYWHFDEDEIVDTAGIWPFLPWEMYYAMDRMVHAGEADWYSSSARAHSGNWLDMLDAGDAALARGHLSDLRNSENGIPDFLYNMRDAAYVNARYGAAMSWIDDKGHMVTSNGPFYLSNLIERDADGVIASMVLRQFDDPSYPLGAGHWSAFADFEPLSGDVVIGSLAPITGNAYRYGEETRAASDLAVSHFNEYLEQRGEKWSIKQIHIDTETDPAAALAGLVALDGQNVKLVNGPVIDIITQNVLGYANSNDMVLVSCCSSSPANAIPGDALFRMLPDQRVHAAEIVRLMTAHPALNLKHVVPVGIDNPWATELLGAAKIGFEDRGVTFSDIITYDASYVQGDGFVAGAEMAAAAEALADEVRLVTGQSRAHNVAVLYVGFGEGPLFLKAAAAAHDVLDDVRWFGADQNTASPNISDDPESAAFASAVSFTTVQPSVPDNLLTSEIRAHLAEMSIAPSPYSSYAYDAVWVLGLAILDAQSSDPADVIQHIKPAAMRHVGAIGSTELNYNGDLASGIYQAWLFSEDGQWSRYSVAEPSSTCR